MSEKKYPPSENRLRQLSREGLLPVSEHVTIFSVYLGLIVGFMLLFGVGGERFLTFACSLFSGKSAQRASIAADSASIGLLLSLSILVPLAVFSLLSSMLQSGFSSRTLRRNHGGQGQRSRNLVFQCCQYFVLPLVFLLWCLFLSAAVVGAFQEYQEQVFHWLFSASDWVSAGANGNCSATLPEVRSQSFPFPIAFPAKLLMLVLFMAGIVSIASRVILIIQFRYDYRMTQEEVEAEIREQEQAKRSLDRETAARRERLDSD